MANLGQLKAGRSVFNVQVKVPPASDASNFPCPTLANTHTRTGPCTGTGPTPLRRWQHVRLLLRQPEPAKGTLCALVAAAPSTQEQWTRVQNKKRAVKAHRPN